MKKLLTLKNKNSELLNTYLKELDLTYIDKIMDFQDVIYKGLENKELYSPSDRDEFIECITKKGKVIGCTDDNGDLIAMGIYIKCGYDKSNYGYDIDLNGEDLLKVGQIECTLVREDYRGNRLQRTICEALEDIGAKENTPIMTATASPYNKFSVDTFKNLGYEIKKDKLKYGGLRRYVLAKDLNERK